MFGYSRLQTYCSVRYRRFADIAAPLPSNGTFSFRRLRNYLRNGALKLIEVLALYATQVFIV
jgi:hypothetical protein